MATETRTETVTVIVTDTSVIVSPNDALISEYVVQLHDWEVPYQRVYLPAAGIWKQARARWPHHLLVDHLDWGLR